MEMIYERVGEQMLPTLQATEENIPRMGMFAQMRLAYLQEHRRVAYLNLLTTGKLNAHLAQIDEQATDMMETLTFQITAREGLSEQMKQTDPMRWVKLMNSIQAQAREIVLSELIYI